MTEIIRRVSKTDTRTLLALIGTLGSFTMLGMMQFHPIPEGNKDVVTLAIGIVLGGSLSNVYSFYFGSSKQDADKNKKEVINGKEI